MRSKLLGYYRQFTTNRLLYITLKPYFLIACMVFFAYSAVLVTAVSFMGTSRITETQSRLLSQTAKIGGTITSDHISAAQKVFRRVNAGLEAMTEPYSFDRSYNTTELINEIKSEYGSIDGIYFFNFKDDVIYTGETPVYASSDFPDTELLSELRGAASNILRSPHILKYENGRSIDEKHTLMSFYKYGDGGMAVFTDTDKLYEILNDGSGIPVKSLTILDNKNTVLFSTDNSVFGTDLSDNQVIKEITETGGSEGYIKHWGTIYCYSRASHDTLYISASSALPVIVSYGKQIALLLLFALLLTFLYFISGIRIGMSLFEPFRRLRGNVLDTLGIVHEHTAEPGTERDLRSILRGIKRHMTKYDAMQRTELEYTYIKRGELICELLTGSAAAGSPQLEECGIELPYTNYTVVIARLDHTAAIKKPRLGTLLTRLSECGTSIFGKDGTLVYPTVFSGGCDTVFLLNHTGQSFSKRLIGLFSKTAKERCGVSVTTAFASGNDQIPELYRRAEYAARCRFTYGHGSLINYDDLLEDIHSDCEYPSRLEKAIVREMGLRNMTGAGKAIEEFFDTLRRMPYSYASAYANMLLSSAVSITGAGSVNDSLKNKLVENELSSPETLDGFKAVVTDICSRSIKTSAVSSKGKYEKLADDIREYIDERYTDPGLSVDMIASHVGRSANYSRTIFKRCKGISISDYIASKRFDEVCRLLRETDLSAVQICLRTGMSANSYFYTAFKKHTGYTLEQYRKHYSNKK